MFAAGLCSNGAQKQVDIRGIYKTAEPTQVTTTRNISGGWFMHWLCGGLEYQVDHHLFPMMPRHSLPKAHELIVSFCKEHDIKYNEDNLWRGTADIIQHLDKVATEFLTEFPAI